MPSEVQLGVGDLPASTLGGLRKLGAAWKKLVIFCPRDNVFKTSSEFTYTVLSSQWWQLWYAVWTMPVLLLPCMLFIPCPSNETLVGHHQESLVMACWLRLPFQMAPRQV